MAGDQPLTGRFDRQRRAAARPGRRPGPLSLFPPEHWRNNPYPKKMKLCGAVTGHLAGQDVHELVARMLNQGLDDVTRLLARLGVVEVADGALHKEKEHLTDAESTLVAG